MKELGIEGIKGILPHRYPFLLVDKIVDYGIDYGIDRGVDDVVDGLHAWAIGVKNLSINEPFFQGHFPDYPIFPGVLAVEALAQVSGLCLKLNGLESQASSSYDKYFYLMKIDEAKFHATMVPGDIVYLHTKQIRKLAGIYMFEAKAIVNDAIRAVAKITIGVKSK